MKTKFDIPSIEKRYGRPIKSVLEHFTAQGLGVSIIASSLNTNTSMIYRLAEKHKVILTITPRSLREQRSDTTDFINRIKKEYGQTPAEIIKGYTDDGYGPDVIASFLDCCRKTVVRWARDAGIILNKRTRADLQPHHAPHAHAIAAAAEVNSKYFEFNGERLTASSAARKLGIDKSTMARRLKTMPLDRALTLSKQPAGRKTRKAAPLNHPWRQDYDRAEHNQCVQ